MNNKPRKNDLQSFKQVKLQINSNLNSIDQLLAGLVDVTETYQQIQYFRQKYAQYSVTKINSVLDEQEIIWKYEPDYNFHFITKEYEPQLLNKLSKKNVNLSKQNKKQLVQQKQFVQQKQIEHNYLPFIRVQCRNNWISQHLDKPFTKIQAISNGRVINIIEQKQQKVITKFEDEEQYKQKEISLQQFYQQNHEVIINYVQHKFMYHFSHQVIRLNILSDLIIVMKVLGSEQHRIRRILIFRKDIGSLNLYQFYKGFYEEKDFVTPIQLSIGSYIFLPLSDSSFNLFTQRQLKNQLSFAHRQPIRQLNLMLQGFKQCHPCEINSEFTRMCDLQSGIIIQIYRNSSEEQIYFKDLELRQQNKKRMFEQLYSQRMKQFEFKKGQTIVKFYEITKKPATLYIPRKIIYINKQLDKETKTIHTILK